MDYDELWDSTNGILRRHHLSPAGGWQDAEFYPLVQEVMFPQIDIDDAEESTTDTLFLRTTDLEETKEAMLLIYGPGGGDAKLLAQHTYCHPEQSRLPFSRAYARLTKRCAEGQLMCAFVSVSREPLRFIPRGIPFPMLSWLTSGVEQPVSGVESLRVVKLFKAGPFVDAATELDYFNIILPRPMTLTNKFHMHEQRRRDYPAGYNGNIQFKVSLLHEGYHLEKFRELEAESRKVSQVLNDPKRGSASANTSLSGITPVSTPKQGDEAPTESQPAVPNTEPGNTGDLGVVVNVLNDLENILETEGNLTPLPDLRLQNTEPGTQDTALIPIPESQEENMEVDEATGGDNQADGGEGGTVATEVGDDTAEQREGNTDAAGTTSTNTEVRAAGRGLSKKGQGASRPVEVAIEQLQVERYLDEIGAPECHYPGNEAMPEDWDDLYNRLNSERAHYRHITVELSTQWKDKLGQVSRCLEDRESENTGRAYELLDTQESAASEMHERHQAERKVREAAYLKEAENLYSMQTAKRDAMRSKNRLNMLHLRAQQLRLLRDYRLELEEKLQEGEQAYHTNIRNIRNHETWNTDEMRPKVAHAISGAVVGLTPADELFSCKDLVDRQLSDLIDDYHAGLDARSKEMQTLHAIAKEEARLSTESRLAADTAWGDAQIILKDLGVSRDKVEAFGIESLQELLNSDGSQTIVVQDHQVTKLRPSCRVHLPTGWVVSADNKAAQGDGQDAGSSICAPGSVDRDGSKVGRGGSRPAKANAQENISKQLAQMSKVDDTSGENLPPSKKRRDEETEFTPADNEDWPGWGEDDETGSLSGKPSGSSTPASKGTRSKRSRSLDTSRDSGSTPFELSEARERAHNKDRDSIKQYRAELLKKHPDLFSDEGVAAYQSMDHSAHILQIIKEGNVTNIQRVDPRIDESNPDYRIHNALGNSPSKKYKLFAVVKWKDVKYMLGLAQLHYPGAFDKYFCRVPEYDAATGKVLIKEKEACFCPYCIHHTSSQDVMNNHIRKNHLKLALISECRMHWASSPAEHGAHSAKCKRDKLTCNLLEGHKASQRLLV